MPSTRTSSEIQADIDAVYAARRSIAAGERVKEVWRDGRRLTFQEMTLTQANDLLGMLERELDAAQSTIDGRPQRRAIGLGWKN